MTENLSGMCIFLQDEKTHYSVYMITKQNWCFSKTPKYHIIKWTGDSGHEVKYNITAKKVIKFIHKLSIEKITTGNKLFDEYGSHTFLFSKVNPHL